ncbi:Crp/Fnr family transcriptional regulator [Micromonospora sp. NBC_01638]|uniref:Crp/Fnr family transcriptional regulator n=1 Tax=Micromonospora sp. NBC_01638 TaxID=2975982 RepID=UPI0038703D44|nr:Crp/Fnr family transcriptional regulator [Micromonospora sp. NBC_01638]
MREHHPHPESFLATLNPEDRGALGRLGTHRVYRPRSTLFHQGEPSRHVILILDGWVKVTSSSRTGDEALLALRGPGDILGELAAVDGRGRSATVHVLLAVNALVIDGERFVGSLTQHPAIALALLRYISRNLRESDRHRLEYVSTSSSARIAARVLELAARHGTDTPDGVVIDLPLSQRELATAAATSREMAARTLRALRERDVLRTSRQRIVVVRPDVLRSLCRSVSSDT